MKITATWFTNDDKEEPITIEAPMGTVEIRPWWNEQFGETVVVKVAPAEGVTLKGDAECVLYTA